MALADMSAKHAETLQQAGGEPETQARKIVTKCANLLHKSITFGPVLCASIAMGLPSCWASYTTKHVFFMAFVEYLQHNGDYSKITTHRYTNWKGEDGELLKVSSLVDFMEHGEALHDIPAYMYFMFYEKRFERIPSENDYIGSEEDEEESENEPFMPHQEDDDGSEEDEEESEDEPFMPHQEDDDDDMSDVPSSTDDTITDDGDDDGDDGGGGHSEDVRELVEEATPTRETRKRSAPEDGSNTSDDEDEDDDDDEEEEEEDEEGEEDEEDEEEDEEDPERVEGRGRPRHPRFRFSQDHPQYNVALNFRVYQPHVTKLVGKLPLRPPDEDEGGEEDPAAPIPTAASEESDKTSSCEDDDDGPNPNDTNDGEARDAYALFALAIFANIHEGNVGDFQPGGNMGQTWWEVYTCWRETLINDEIRRLYPDGKPEGRQDPVPWQLRVLENVQDQACADRDGAARVQATTTSLNTAEGQATREQGRGGSVEDEPTVEPEMDMDVLEQLMKMDRDAKASDTGNQDTTAAATERFLDELEEIKKKARDVRLDQPSTSEPAPQEQAPDDPAPPPAAERVPSLKAFKEQARKHKRALRDFVIAPMAAANGAHQPAARHANQLRQYVAGAANQDTRQQPPQEPAHREPHRGNPTFVPMQFPGGRGVTLADAIHHFTLNKKMSFALRLMVESYMRLGRMQDGRLNIKDLLPQHLLKMLLIGPPGTGKSRVILAFQWYIMQLGMGDTVIITSFMGRAAANLNVPQSGIRTATSSSLLGLSRNQDGPSLRQSNGATLDRVATNLLRIAFLIWDELFTASCTHFKTCDAQATVGLQDRATNDRCFGGLPSCLVGDPFQHIPVAGAPLFSTADKQGSTSQAQNLAAKISIAGPGASSAPANTTIAHRTYNSFDTVIMLDEQMRTDGSEGGRRLQEMNDRARNGKLTEADWDAINSRAIRQPEMPETLADARLQNARFMVVRRKAIAPLLDAELPARAQAAGKQLLVWHAHDQLKGSNGGKTDVPENISRTVRHLMDGVCDGMIGTNYFYPGMEVCLKSNARTDLNFATNEIATAVKLELDPREPEPTDLAAAAQTRKLKYQPLGMVVKLKGAYISIIPLPHNAITAYYLLPTTT